MVNDYRAHCIVELDVVGFTSLYANSDEQREVIKSLRSILDKAGCYLFPYGSFSNKFLHHGTGDGYYIVLETIPPSASLNFVLKVKDELDSHNSKSGIDFPLQLRCVLSYGSMEIVEDQLYGTVLADSERLMSDQNFKQIQKDNDIGLALILTKLFHMKLNEEIGDKIGRSPDF